MGAPGRACQDTLSMVAFPARLWTWSVRAWQNGTSQLDYSPVPHILRHVQTNRNRQDEQQILCTLRGLNGGRAVRLDDMPQ